MTINDFLNMAAYGRIAKLTYTDCETQKERTILGTITCVDHDPELHRTVIFIDTGARQLGIELPAIVWMRYEDLN
jgi:hypothetical protein